PSLMIGVLLGHSFAVLANALFATSLDPIVFALVGMGGVLAGINAIPLTSILLVFEVTGDYHFILPLMFVSIIAYLVVIYVNRGGTYALELMKEGIDVSKRGEMDLLGKIKVRELRKTDFDVVSHRTPFRKLADILMHSTYGDVFVLNDKKELLGVISLRQVRQAIVSHELTELLIADDVTAEVPVVTEDDPVSLAMQKIEEYDLETIPVVKSEKNRSVTGVLTHRDIIQAYNRLLDTWTTDQFLTDSKPRGS
ncbi:MAG: chloride channel protein, partial [Spirochaetes bacterium]|nr:chloride channel protein [Spirochaetota bacterium]